MPLAAVCQVTDCRYWKQTEPLRVVWRIRRYLADISRGLLKVMARICSESLRKTKKTLRGPAMAHPSAPHRRFSGSIPGRCMWDMWWTVWQWERSFFRILRFHPHPHPFSYIPQVLHTHSLTYQRHYTIVTPDDITYNTTKHISKYRLRTGLDSNRDPSEYKPKPLPLHQPTQWFVSDIPTDFILYIKITREGKQKTRD